MNMRLVVHTESGCDVDYDNETIDSITDSVQDRHLGAVFYLLSELVAMLPPGDVKLSKLFDNVCDPWDHIDIFESESE